MLQVQDLPEKLQREIISYLKADDFPSAKKIRDDWYEKQKAAEKTAGSSEDTESDSDK